MQSKDTEAREQPKYTHIHTHTHTHTNNTYLACTQYSHSLWGILKYIFIRPWEKIFCFLLLQSKWENVTASLILIKWMNKPHIKSSKNTSFHISLKKKKSIRKSSKKQLNKYGTNFVFSWNIIASVCNFSPWLRTEYENPLV